MYGDTAAGRKRVAQLREQGGDIRALASRLVSQAEAAPWHGKAADAMRERIKERADHLRTAAAHHETAADSLARHLSEVDGLKEAIDIRSHKAISLVEDARTRASRAATHPDGTPAEHDQTDAALLAFDPPPAGHRDWLTVDLPGL
jgi:superfamily I DNA/RNA helicase